MFDISFIHYLNTLNNNRYQTKYLKCILWSYHRCWQYDIFSQNCAPWIGNMTFLVEMAPPGLGNLYQVLHSCLRGSVWPFSTVASSTGRLLDPFLSHFFRRPQDRFSPAATKDIPARVHSPYCPTCLLRDSYLISGVPSGCKPSWGSYILGALARLVSLASGHGHHVYFHHPRGPFGSRKLGTWLPQTDGSAVCIYAYWSMK